MAGVRALAREHALELLRPFAGVGVERVPDVLFARAENLVLRANPALCAGQSGERENGDRGSRESSGGKGDPCPVGEVLDQVDAESRQRSERRDAEDSGQDRERARKCSSGQEEDEGDGDGDDAGEEGREKGDLHRGHGTAYVEASSSRAARDRSSAALAIRPASSSDGSPAPPPVYVMTAATIAPFRP